MDFAYARTVATTAPPAAVWALWSDPTRWASWDPAIESVSLEGDFAAGATGSAVLTGGIEVPVRLSVVEPGTRYLDVLEMGELHISVDHVVVAVGSGAEVTVRVEIAGPGAQDIGPVVTADSPVAMAALVALAEGRA